MSCFSILFGFFEIALNPRRVKKGKIANLCLLQPMLLKPINLSISPPSKGAFSFSCFSILFGFSEIVLNPRRKKKSMHSKFMTGDTLMYDEVPPGALGWLKLLVQSLSDVSWGNLK